MKNKIFLVIVLILIIAIISALAIMFDGKSFATVRCVVTEGGTLCMVYNNRLVVLNYNGKTHLTTGDKIFVVFNSAFAESYPEQTKASIIIKLSDGDPFDIQLNDEYAEQMKDMGFVIN